MQQQVVDAVLRKPQSLNVSSSAFSPGGTIPREFSGHSDDASPPIAWGNVPASAAALAIVVDDPDAPRGTFTHWTAWNLPPTERGIPRAATVKSIGAVEGKNDFGAVGYRGPLPPSGTHRYFFRVFALESPLPLSEGASPDDVWGALRDRVIAWGEVVGTFSAR